MLSIQKHRYEQLRKLVTQSYNLITECETILLFTQMPTEKFRLKRELEEIRSNLKEFKAEISELEAEMKTRITGLIQIYADSEEGSSANANLDGCEIVVILEPGRGSNKLPARRILLKD